MKVKIKGFICLRDGDPAPYFYACDMAGLDWITVIAPVETEIDFELPEGFNLVAAKVAALNAKLDKINDAHMEEVLRIKGKIAELQCIENQVAA